MKNPFLSALALLLISACSNGDQTIHEMDELVEENVGEPRTDLEGLNLPTVPYNYSAIDLPAHFTATEVLQADNTPANNPVQDEGATLGRVLFYDKAMSLNNSTSCASCHTQQSGFSDPNVFSEGFEGNLTGRNSMGLSNARYYQSGHFFWDERAETLEEQVLMPIQDPVEMGMDLDSLERKLSTTYYYPILFSEAFGDSTITAERISLALAQFVRSMVSYESLYDQAIEANGGSDDGNLPLLSSTENLGKSLFFGRGGCNNCHSTNVFIADQAFNNGLDAGENEDNGVGGVTGRNNDLGLFKVPSLRNIGLGTPFMHDGRFSTLREVVTFYNDGVQDHPNISREMLGRNGEIRRLNLSEDEIDAIVAFMETLTDENFIQDEKFSDPFIAP